jgi:hypothetical protein
MDLLFSVTNAAEISGPQGKSADAIRTFLDEIGPRWVPGEFSPLDVVNRELKITTPPENSPCLSEDFLRRYVASRLRSYEPGSGKVIDMSESFFRLGAVLDWVGPQRDSIREGSLDFDTVLKNKFVDVAVRSNLNRRWLDAVFPSIPYDSARPAHFVYQNLMRVMVLESATFKPGDGMDFCHAVLASAYGSFATLDRRWKHRIASLPKPNNLARIYSGQELNSMIDDMELWLRARSR